MKKLITAIALVVAASTAAAGTPIPSALSISGNNISCTTFGNTTNCMRY